MTNSDLETIRAELHLRAVLPSLEQLARWDRSVLASFSDDEITFALSYPNATASCVRWSQHILSTQSKMSGGFSIERAAASICTRLRFWSARHLNETFDGHTQFPPFPLGGWMGLRRLNEFDHLTAALRQVMEPTVAQMQETAFFERHVLMNFTIALRAFPVLLANDKIGRETATRLPHGLYEFVLRTQHYGVVRWGLRRASQQCDFSMSDGRENSLIRITFSTPQVLYRILCLELDQVAAIGLGEIQIEGLVPLADELGHVLERVESYLPLRRPKA